MFILYIIAAIIFGSIIIPMVNDFIQAAEEGIERVCHCCVIDYGYTDSPINRKA